MTTGFLTKSHETNLQDWYGQGEVGQLVHQDLQIVSALSWVTFNVDDRKISSHTPLRVICLWSKHCDPIRGEDR